MQYEIREINDASMYISIDLAIQYLREGNALECVECMERIRASGLWDAQCCSILGAACSELGDSDRAIAAFKEALDICPSAKAHYNLGAAYQETGSPFPAVQLFLRAVEIDSTYRPALDALERFTLIGIAAEDTPETYPESVTETVTTDAEKVDAVDLPDQKQLTSEALSEAEARPPSREARVLQVHKQMMTSGLFYGVIVGVIALTVNMFVFRLFMIVPFGLVWTVFNGAFLGAIAGFWIGFTGSSDVAGAKIGAFLGVIGQGGLGLSKFSVLGSGGILILISSGAIVGGGAGFLIGRMVEKSIGN